jgi:hypothetical protein
VSVRTICGRDVSLQYASSGNRIPNPRNPQQPSITGHAKDCRAKEAQMRIISSIRSLWFAFVVLAISAGACAQVSISVSFAPPELPVYEQPLCPGDGYLWTPGYWAYADNEYGYYWVPGTWVMAPEPGLLWTPAYWGWGGNGYRFYDGYWGTEVGFYGGISYGYGYFGDGYQGGRWQNGQFYYNRSVNNLNITNTNVYNTTIINSTTVNRVSYNGGTGGISAHPTAQQETLAKEKHIPAVAAQTQHAAAARANPQQRASVNQGKPPVAATPKPGAFNDRAVVPAKAAGAPYSPPVNRAALQTPAKAPVTRPENKAARTEQAVPNSRPEPTPAEPNRPEANRPSTTPPNNPEPSRPEPNRPAVTPPTNRPEHGRDEPVQRPLATSPGERSQSERTPAKEPERAAPQEQRPKPAARAPEVQKKKDEPPKSGEKSPQ